MRSLLAGLALVSAVAVTADAAAPRQDWAAVVTRAPNGAFVLGNPRAKVKLVEYLSLTCNHCAAFSAEGWPSLKDRYIRSGAVSFEVRHALRDPFDLAASLIARCQGAAGYFQITEAILAGQGEWLPRATALAGPTEGMPIEAVLARIAKGSGLERIAQARGMTPDRVRDCLASKGDRERLAAMAEEAWQQRKIAGTPAFLINGTPASAHQWAVLEPLLAAAVN